MTSTAALVLGALIAGTALGAVLVLTVLGRELSSWSAFLSTRDRSARTRLSCSAPLTVLQKLAITINHELDCAEVDANRARAAANELSRGLSALSHDARTPLAGARGNLQLALREKDMASACARIKRADERLASLSILLDELFTCAKINDPDAKVELERVLVRPLIENVLLGFWDDMNGRGWEPRVLMPEGDVWMWADPRMTTRIIENLIKNALQHGSSAPCIEVATESSKVHVSIANEVANPADLDVERMFERFWQGHTERGAEHGTGLGMSIAQGLAHAQGMELTASCKDARLVITLTSPLAQQF